MHNFAAMICDTDPDWFKTWFDSPYYPILYAHRDHTEADSFIRNVTGVLHMDQGARILDLACGQGRHALAMASLGYEVTGADLSQESISEAKKTENDHLHFVVHDMRRPIAVNYFDAVLNLFTSFGYFYTKRDNIRTIDAVHSCLKPNGYFILDYFNAHCVRATVNSNDSGETVVDGIHFSWKKLIEANKVIKQIRVEDKGNIHQYCESVTLFTRDDFSEMLHGKFDIMMTFGDYNLSAFDERTSPRLILVCRKR